VRDLLALAQAHPELVEELSAQRPLLNNIVACWTQLEAALDAERRSLIRANEMPGALSRSCPAVGDRMAHGGKRNWPNNARNRA